MRHRIEYLLLRLVSAATALLPLRAMWWISGCIATGATLLGTRRVTIALDNVRHAFPDWRDSHRRRIATESVRHLIQTLFEIPSLARASRMAIAKRLRIHNAGLERELMARFGGVILLSAHYGNWELAALSGAIQFESPMTIIGKPQRNTYVDDYLNAIRERFGNTIVPMEGGVRPLLRTLQSNGIVALLADQRASDRDVLVPFFHRPAPTTTAVAALSLKLNVPIVIGLATRLPDLTYTMELVEVDRSDLREYSEENIRTLTARHVAVLESMIRKHPEQWLWVHRRWPENATVTHA